MTAHSFAAQPAAVMNLENTARRAAICKAIADQVGKAGLDTQECTQGVFLKIFHHNHPDSSAILFVVAADASQSWVGAARDNQITSLSLAEIPQGLCARSAIQLSLTRALSHLDDRFESAQELAIENLAFEQQESRHFSEPHRFAVTWSIRQVGRPELIIPHVFWMAAHSCVFESDETPYGWRNSPSSSH